jgi:hypothetical protein
VTRSSEEGQEASLVLLRIKQNGSHKICMGFSGEYRKYLFVSQLVTLSDSSTFMMNIGTVAGAYRGGLEGNSFVSGKNF